MELEMFYLPEVADYPRVPDVAANTLGRRAVVLAVHGDAEAAALNTAAEQKDLLLDNLNERHRELQFEVRDVQNRIRALDSDRVVMFEEYCRNSAPSFLRAMKSHQAFEYSWAHWLSQADEEALLAFLNWHVEAHERMAQEPEVKAAVVEQKAQYKEGLKRGMETGWIHPDAAAAIVKADLVKVYMGDIFDVMFEERGGYHTQGTMEYVIGAGLDVSERGVHNVVDNVKRLAKHEETHAVHPGFRPRWRNEATTEHIAHSIDHGKPDVMDPQERLNLIPPKYPSERLLFDWLLKNGRRRIPVSLVTRAYTQVDGGDDETKALEMAFDEAWGYLVPEGRGALSVVDRYMAAQENINRLLKMKQIEAGDIAARSALKVLEKDPRKVFSFVSRRPAPQFVA